MPSVGSQAEADALDAVAAECNQQNQRPLFLLIDNAAVRLPWSVASAYVGVIWIVPALAHMSAAELLNVLDDDTTNANIVTASDRKQDGRMSLVWIAAKCIVTSGSARDVIYHPGHVHPLHRTCDISTVLAQGECLTEAADRLWMLSVNGHQPSAAIPASALQSHL